MSENILNDCKTVYENFDNLPVAVQEVITTMVKEIGAERTSKFGIMKRSICADPPDYEKAANSIVASKWYGQDSQTAGDVAEKLRNVI